MYKARIKEKWLLESVWKNLTGLQKVLIPAEHLWCDFTCRPWAKNSLPNTNDLYIYYMDKCTRTPPSLEERKALPNCGNKDGNIIHVLTIFISTSVATVLKCMKWLYPYVIGVWWFLAQGLHLKSHQRASRMRKIVERDFILSIRNWLDRCHLLNAAISCKWQLAKK